MCNSLTNKDAKPAHNSEDNLLDTNKTPSNAPCPACHQLSLSYHVGVFACSNCTYTELHNDSVSIE